MFTNIATSAVACEKLGLKVLPMQLSPSQVGAIAEVSVAMALTKTGRTVWVPFFSNHSRIDLLYENADGVVRRVQCKSALVVNDTVAFYTCSHTGGVERTYVGDVDEFGVYCPETGDVYMVPVAGLPSRRAFLRIAPTKSNQTRGIRWAADYVLRSP